MKYLLVLILPIVFLLGCKKPEEVKPELLSDTSYIDSALYVAQNLDFYLHAYPTLSDLKYISNDTIYIYFSNLDFDIEKKTQLLVTSKRNDSISINNSTFKLTFKDSLAHSNNILNIKTNQSKIYRFHLILKKRYISFKMNKYYDSLCLDSVSIFKNISLNSQFISSNNLRNITLPNYIYNDQLAAIDGRVNFSFYAGNSKSYSQSDPFTRDEISINVLNLKRDQSSLVNTYTIGKDALIILGKFEKKFENSSCYTSRHYITNNSKTISGTLTITSYNSVSKTISGTFSFTANSEYIEYKSSPAKITVTDGKFENISLWGDK